MTWFLSALVGFVTGILSGMGIGGGTLLVLWLTLVAGVPQREAQGINLLYFCAVAPPSIVSHLKNGLIPWKQALFAVAAGLPVSIAAAVLAANTDISLLRRGFGVITLIIGVKELLCKKDDGQDSDGAKQKS